MMPALLISTSTRSTRSANARTERRSCRSSSRTSTLPVIPAAAWAPFAVLRTARIVVAPTRANSRAVTSPRPLFAPVTMTVRPAKEGRSAAVHALMANTLMAADWSPLFLGGAGHRDVEAGDDRFDVGRLGGGLVRVTGHRELHEVPLIGGRGAGGDDDAVVAVHAATVEVVAALDHRGRKALPVVGGGVEPPEILRQLGIGVAVLDGLGDVEVAVELEHHQ